MAGRSGGELGKIRRLWQEMALTKQILKRTLTVGAGGAHSLLEASAPKTPMWYPVGVDDYDESARSSLSSRLENGLAPGPRPIESGDDDGSRRRFRLLACGDPGMTRPRVASLGSSTRRRTEAQIGGVRRWVRPSRFSWSCLIGTSP
jgi:hypothetical protein